jgi:peptide chain release factor subunit 1
MVARMAAAAPDPSAIRRLAEIRLDRPVVLSLYLDLDPSEFATPPARATAVRSLLDGADRKLRERGSLSHADRTQLEASLDKARELWTRNLDADGAHVMALFACEAENLMETLKLPRSVPSRVSIDRSPLVGPLAGVARRERWCVVLVSKQDARVFRGSPDGLREVDKLHDDVHGRHDQGGMSQARYQRSIEKDVADHLKAAADRLLRHYERQPFERLVVGGPREAAAELEAKLHCYLSGRVAGRIEVDVETARPDQVLEAAREHFESHEQAREDEAIERLEEGSRAEAGLENVLRPLNERRVEVLLLEERFAAPGTLCPQCGWLGPAGEARCPADGTELEQREDVTEPAIELALQQAAEVLPLRRRGDDLRARGGIGALLRF